MFLFKFSKNMDKNDKRRIPTYLLVNILTLIIKYFKSNVEQGTVVTTLNVIKH